MQNSPYCIAVFTLCPVTHPHLLIGHLTSFLMQLTPTLKVHVHACGNDPETRI